MKYTTRLLLLVGLFLSLSAFSTIETTSVEGTWVGEFTSIDHSVPFKVRFWQKNNELKGTVNLPDENSKDFPLSWVLVESPSVHFELVRKSGTLVFDGELKNGKISGDLLFSGLRGKFQLSPDKLVSL